ncbi:MAG: hypothetical protein ACRDD1_09000 [Planctomycetia bacterium]
MEESRNDAADLRLLNLVGAGLFLSGAAHAAWWFIVGGSWEGPLSLRKPILFGVSSGVTCWSLAWAASFLPATTLRRWEARLLAVALTVEVGLITMQTHRGVASHFNETTPIDAVVSHTMGWLIVGVWAVVAAWTWRLHAYSPGRPAPADALVAARMGMALLTAGCALGATSTAYGVEQAARGLSPEVYGAAGVVKTAHGVALHGIQWLAAAAWLMRAAGVPETRRRWAVETAGVGCVALTLFALAQTLNGRSRFDVADGALLLAVLGLALQAAPFVVAAIWTAGGRRLKVPSP